MVKRRRRRGVRGKLFSSIGSFIGVLFRGCLKILPLIILVVLIAFLFLGVREALYADSRLHIEKIDIEPLEGISSAMRQKLESKVLGKNILKVHLKDIANEIENNPEILQARVIRQFPSSLKIEIVKRKPIAFIQLSSRGAFGLVSEDGMVLDVSKSRNNSLVLIQAYGVKQRNPRLGSRISFRGFSGAIKFLKAFWTHPIADYETISKISFDHLGNVVVTLGSGPDVRLGRYPLERIKALGKIAPVLEGQGREKIEYIDLQFDDVIVKRRG